MENNTPSLSEAERQLEQARRILAHPVNLDSDEWMLVATLVGEADLTIQSDRHASGEVRKLLREVVSRVNVRNGSKADSGLRRVWAKNSPTTLHASSPIALPKL